MKPPCEHCGRAMWRWKSYSIVNDQVRQVLVRPFKWRWYNVRASLDKNSGYRKIYVSWVIRGPFEIRVWRRPLR